MSIADKLNYLNETKRHLREAINIAFGVELTENTPFREYANVEGLWNPRLLFLSGEQGVWYDPSDVSALFQDADGTIPVTADGDPVGLMLDRRLPLGSYTVFDPDRIDPGWTDNGDGSYTHSGSLFSGIGMLSAFPGLPSRGLLSFTIDDSNGGNLVIRSIFGEPSTNLLLNGEPGEYEIAYDLKGGEGIYFFPGSSPRWNGTISNISFRELPGNHASQAVSASRPIYRTDGTLHWLEFDGVDDFLSVQPVDMSHTNQQVIYAGLRKEGADGSFRALIETGTNVNSTRGVLISAPSSDSDANYRIRANAGAGAENISSSTGSFSGVTTNVITGVHAPGVVGTRLSVDGQEVSSGLAANNNGNFENVAWTIGSRLGTTAFFLGRVYGMVVVDNYAVSRVALAEQFLATKSGVTLP